MIGSFFSKRTIYAGIASIAMAAAAQAAARDANFNIPPQSVETALIAYSEQSGMQLVMAANTGETVKSNGIKGEMDVIQALDHLLEETGLQYEVSGSGTISVTLAQTDEGSSSGTENNDTNGDQESYLSTPNGQQNSFAIDEILVTAEKRQVSLQRTSISIAAFTDEHLRRSVIDNIYDIGMITPGVIVNKEIVGKIYIRGIGTENLTIGGDPGVPVHADGVYLARTSAANFDLYDTERVEVLRGPQGTLYGRNATGGSVNIISKAPQDEFGGRVDLRFGNYDHYRAHAMVNVPLVEDKLLMRANIVRSQRDGYTPNLFTGEDLDDEDLIMGRLRLKFYASDNVTIDLIADYSDDDSSPQPFKQLEFSPLFEGALNAFDPPGLRPVSQDSPVHESQSQLGITGIINVEFDRLTLTAISGYRDTDFSAQFDGDAVDILFQNFSDDSESQQFSQEIQLASKDWKNLEWIVGLYYFRDDGDTTIFIPIPGFGFNILHNATIDTEAFAVFGQVTWHATNKINLTTGLRYSQEDKKAFQFSDFGFIPPLQQNLSEDSDALTPRFVVEFSPTDETMLYASATRGFKSGGFTFNGFQSNFDPEFVWAYEVGVKTRNFDDRLQTNASGFYYTYTDLQVSKLQNNAGVITNAADATIWGGEVEIVAKPTQRFEINGGVAYLNAEFDEFLTEDPSFPMLGTIDLGGNVMPRSPKFTANIGVQYTYPIEDQAELSFRVDYRHQSKSYFTPFNRDLSAQMSFSLVNARMAVTDIDGNWQIAAYIENALDEEYFLNILESGVEAGKPEGFLAAPQTFGIQFSRAF